jgi:predicted 3-demethylubiquinone-9 3-methyltransferase (glyoxalase superfamily)
MQKIRPWLWFNDRAEEAARFYVSVFPNSSLSSLSYYGDGAPLPAGTAMVANFVLDGVQFMALNGGSDGDYAPAFYVDCETQEEIDRLWDRLSEGGEPGQCGWLKDRFGISWNIVPSILGDLMTDDDEEKAGRVMAAMLKMGKLDIPALERAHAGT